MAFLSGREFIHWGNIGIVEKKMETTIVYWGYIRIMEKKLEATIVYCHQKQSVAFLWWLSQERYICLCRRSFPNSGYQLTLRCGP